MRTKREKTAGSAGRVTGGAARRRVVNVMKMTLPALSVNEGMARAAVAAFCAQMNPTAVELADVKCAVSEAVTNCIVHAYRQTDRDEDENEEGIDAAGRKKRGGIGDIHLTVRLCAGDIARIEIRDRGCGIPDVKQAMQPLFTTDPEGERSGMGFTVMESFCDHVRVSSKPGKGTTVVLWKQFSGGLDSE